MKHSKSSLFLMELIIAILFFSLASAVCIQLFAKSHLLGNQTVNENHAVIHAQNLAECFLATEGNMQQLKELFPAATTDNSNHSIILLFDENWRECNAEAACYAASLTAHPKQDGLITADITISSHPSSEDYIYTLTIVHHIPERSGNIEHSFFPK